jgi:hypothetical protein
MNHVDKCYFRFANTTAQNGASWTFQFFDETNVQPAKLLPNNPKFYIAEAGWPTKSSDAGNANNGASDASEANLQIFMDNFVCQVSHVFGVITRDLNIGYRQIRITSHISSLSSRTRNGKMTSTVVSRAGGAYSTESE